MEFQLHLNYRLIATLSSVLYMPPNEIIRMSGIANSTWYRLMQQPQTIPIQQLLGIANGLHIPVKRFFYTGDTCVVGLREEYVTIPYSECRYDGDALQEFVNNTDSATWMQAAKEIGVTRDNLRHSLLGARRTPVTRFLEVCHIFGIDPYTILIDPNPETAPQDKNKPVAASVRRDIKELKQQISELTTSGSQLSDQYQHLLTQHEALLRELRAYTGGGSRTKMVNEDRPEPAADHT
jgi:hypothetical protein